jgi:acyl transferase domain-containing protein
MQESGNRDAANVFIEIGPHSALQGPLRQILSATPDVKWSYLAPLARGKNSSSTFATAIARLFELGASLNLHATFEPTHGAATLRVLGNMAPYPWDHQVKHWSESRLSRDYRLRPFPYHDLLGLYDEHSSIEEPRWRHQLSLERLPWLRHHIVDGQVVFPLTGYTCMMLEGLSQLLQMRNPGSKIATYVLKNTRIHRPIILAQDQNEGTGPDVEVQLVLSPSKTSSDSPWYSVRILSLQQDGKWAEHVSTLIRVELQSSSEVDASVSFGDEHSIASQEAFEALERVTALAKDAIDPKVMYAEHRQAGNDWGPSFTLTTEAYIGQGVALAKLRNPHISQWMPHSYCQPHLIHPTTLDAANHLMATLFHKQVLNAPLMPVTIDESIFTSDIISAPGEEMIVAIEIEPIGKTALKGNAWMFQRAPDSGELKLVIISTGSQLQAVGEEVGGPAQTFERETNTQMVWKEDPGFLNDATFHALTSPQAARSPEFYEQLDFNEKAALIYLDKVKDMPVVRNPETAPLPHLQHYCRWISDWTSTNAFRNAIGSMGEEEKASILEKSLKSGSHEGAIIRRIGLNLPGILGNTVNSLDLMLEGSLLSDWYKEGPMLPVNRQMVEYFNTLTHKNPQMNILEVGAGTGSAAAHLFNALGDNGRNLIKHYCYTDISAGFFEQGRSLPNKWKALLDFKVLDVSKDPIEQGFEPNQFDLVIASNVLHATPSMSKTLENVRKLLKPGGRMLLLELVRSSAAVNIVFGTLPG